MGSPQAWGRRPFGGFLKYIPKLIQEAKLFKNTNLVVEPEFTSGEATQLEAKFDLGSNLIRYIK